MTDNTIVPESDFRAALASLENHEGVWKNKAKDSLKKRLEQVVQPISNETYQERFMEEMNAEEEGNDLPLDEEEDVVEEDDTDVIDEDDLADEEAKERVHTLRMQVRDSAGSLQAMAERVTMKAMNLANQEMEIANQDSTIIAAVNFDEIQKRFLQTSSVEPTQQVKQMMAHVAKVSSLLQKVQPQESTELLEETVDAVEMQLSLGKTMSQTEQAIRSRTNEEIPKLVRSSTVNQDAQEQLASFLGEH